MQSIIKVNVYIVYGTSNKTVYNNTNGKILELKIYSYISQKIKGPLKNILDMCRIGNPRFVITPQFFKALLVLNLLYFK